MTDPALTTLMRLIETALNPFRDLAIFRRIGQTIHVRDNDGNRFVVTVRRVEVEGKGETT